MKKQTVGIYTLGCRLNIYESDGILNQFISNGYQAVNWEDGPDIAIINTCTVTSHADSKNRYIIRNLLKKKSICKNHCNGLLCPNRPRRIAKNTRGLGNYRKRKKK